MYIVFYVQRNFNNSFPRVFLLMLIHDSEENSVGLLPCSIVDFFKRENSTGA